MDTSPRAPPERQPSNGQCCHRALPGGRCHTPGGQSHLEDAGDRLYQAAASGEEAWAVAFGGERAVALLAAEVSALMSHLVARAASVRSVCVDALLDEFSAVTVAGALGVARQKVYELARPNIDPEYLTTTPWRSR